MTEEVRFRLRAVGKSAAPQVYQVGCNRQMPVNVDVGTIYGYDTPVGGQVRWAVAPEHPVLYLGCQERSVPVKIGLVDGSVSIDTGGFVHELLKPLAAVIPEVS